MRLGTILRNTVGPVVDVVLPSQCWADGAGEVTLGLSIEAREQIAALAAQRYCFHCGLTVGPYEVHDRRNPCGRCWEREPAGLGVIRVARVGTFSDPLVRLVHRLKFGRSWEIAAVLAPFLYHAMLQASETTHVAVDVMVPVPLHWTRRARRGFNQAEELTRELRKLSKWPLAKLLTRHKRTAGQAQTMSRDERANNLRGAFIATRSASRYAGKHVWLIDDVSTTGATLRAAASALRQLPKSQRPASINAAVVCITDRGDRSRPTVEQLTENI